MGMRDYLRESFSYFGLFRRMKRYPKSVTPEYQSFGPDKEQYFLYFEPSKTTSNKVIFWIHGGGWNAGNPKDFDYVGQSISNEGYRVVSFGYRLTRLRKTITLISLTLRGMWALADRTVSDPIRQRL